MKTIKRKGSEIETRLNENREAIKKLLAEITDKVSAYGVWEDKNWAHVGSLAHVKEELENVNNFLG